MIPSKIAIFSVVSFHVCVCGLCFTMGKKGGGKTGFQAQDYGNPYCSA